MSQTSFLLIFIIYIKVGQKSETECALVSSRVSPAEKEPAWPLGSGSRQITARTKEHDAKEPKPAKEQRHERPPRMASAVLSSRRAPSL
jgi:hypothetical protein